MSDYKAATSLNERSRNSVVPSTQANKKDTVIDKKIVKSESESEIDESPNKAKSNAKVVYPVPKTKNIKKKQQINRNGNNPIMKKNIQAKNINSKTVALNKSIEKSSEETIVPPIDNKSTTFHSSNVKEDDNDKSTSQSAENETKSRSFEAIKANKLKDLQKI